MLQVHICDGNIDFADSLRMGVCVDRVNLSLSPNILQQEIIIRQ